MAAYGTNAEGVTYFATRLNTEAWDDASDADRTAARTEATQAIDSLSYNGKMTDSAQANQFPRNDDSTTPTEIEEACYEEALIRLDGKDPDMEFDNLGMISQAYANVRSAYDKDKVATHIAAGIMSIRAWRLLYPYLRDPNTVELRRTS